MATINEALWELRDTYRAEPNPDRKQQLQDQYDRALSAVLDMADKDIGDNTEAFAKAVDGLDDSIASLRQTKRDLGDVAKAIKNVAKAVDVVVKVAAKVVGA
jgi:ABC-type transporter Mla subunit MlaD